MEESAHQILIDSLGLLQCSLLSNRILASVRTSGYNPHVSGFSGSATCDDNGDFLYIGVNMNTHGKL